MARITLRQLLDYAAERSYGVPAFNVNNMEQALAIMEAARSVNAPVIIQASRGARAYAGDIMFAKMMEALELMYPEIPLCIHQDHGERVSTCLSAIQNGFTSVMMDGSLKEDGKTPGNFDYNVAITSEVARLAHMVGASVEGELGCLGSLETGHGEAEDGHGFEGKLDRKSLLTDPDEASVSSMETRVDALAVAIGTSHGAYKFTRKPTSDVLAMDVIEKIHAKLPNTHIVMHGSSSVPEEYRALFNENGGEMRETYGVPVEEIVRGIKHRRAQGQYRHRPAPRRHRGISPRRQQAQVGIRSAQVPETGDGRDGQSVPRPVRSFRLRRPGCADQGQADERNGSRLRQRRARSGDRGQVGAA